MKCEELAGGIFRTIAWILLLSLICALLLAGIALHAWPA